MDMINLGSYSGKNCPDVRFRPALIDRMLEGIALLVVLATWAVIGWLYIQKGEPLSSAVWVAGGCSLLSFLLVGGSAYLPIRFINFPVRVTERNVAVQYLLAVRLVRVLNIVLSLVLLAWVLTVHYVWGELLFFVSFVLLGLALAGYYALAFKCK